MKKKILVMIICASLVLGVAGCGSTGSDSTATSSAVSSAAETVVPTATPTPEQSGITADQFGQITMGMTYDQVKQVMGSDGTVQSESEVSGVKTTIYIWSNPDGMSNVTVTVQNDSVDAKAQIGIIETGNVATADKFDQIQTGMSLDEINGIMGESGAMSSESLIAGVDSSIYVWQGTSLGTNCTVSFTDGAVSAKSQIGLE